MDSPVQGKANRHNLAPRSAIGQTVPVKDSKRRTPSIDPDNIAWNGRLWLRVRTADGIRLLINWRRIVTILIILALAGWLGGAGALWAFVKYRRGVDTVRFVDIAFLPLRIQDYRQTLSRHYFTLAEKQLAEGAWSKAIFNLRQAVGKDPRNHEARRALAEMFVRMQRSDLALRTLEDGVADGKTNPDYMKLLFAILAEQGNSDRIIALGSQTLPGQPDDSPHHREIVRMMINAHLARAAYADARQLAKTWFPANSPEQGLLLARIEQAAGFPDLAIMQLESLHVSHPGDESVALNLVQSYQKSGRLQDARRVASMRLLHRPDSPGAACDLISLLFETGEIAAAQKELDIYLTKFAGDTRALMLIANAAMRLKLPALARQVRQHAPQDEYGRTDVSFLLAEMAAECRAGNFAAALALGEEFAQHEPLSPVHQGGLFQLRVWASYAVGLTTEGESWFNQFLTLNYPAWTRDALTLAAHLQSVPAPDPARRVFQTLLERNPDDRFALLALVEHDLKQEAWTELSRRVPQLLALDPLPTDLLQSLWQQGQDRLLLPPDLRERLRNLAP